MIFQFRYSFFLLRLRLGWEYRRTKIQFWQCGHVATIWLKTAEAVTKKFEIATPPCENVAFFFGHTWAKGNHFCVHLHFCSEGKSMYILCLFRTYDSHRIPFVYRAFRRRSNTVELCIYIINFCRHWLCEPNEFLQKSIYNCQWWFLIFKFKFQITIIN